MISALYCVQKYAQQQTSIHFFENCRQRCFAHSFVSAIAAINNVAEIDCEIDRADVCPPIDCTTQNNYGVPIKPLNRLRKVPRVWNIRILDVCY